MAAPSFAFGVISDVQHADIVDGHSFYGTPRFYRNAKVGLQRAVSAWSQAGDLDFAVHFGDIVDGKQPKDRSEEVLQGLLDIFGQLQRPVYHMLGNHCLYNLPRPQLNAMLGIPPAEGGGSYYALQPAPGWRIVVMDSYDVSALGWPEDHPLQQLAMQLLDKHNPNQEKNSADGLTGPARRWVKYGGGASAQQLAWLEHQLQEAKTQRQRVMVFSHQPLLPGSAPNSCLQWFYQETLDILRASGVVVLTMSGHAHANGYAQDQAGIHHVVLPAVLETPPGMDCYGAVHVFEDRLELHGVQAMHSLQMPLATAVWADVKEAVMS